MPNQTCIKQQLLLVYLEEVLQFNKGSQVSSILKVRRLRKALSGFEELRIVKEGQNRIDVKER